MISQVNFDSPITKTIKVLEDEVKYLSNLVRKLELENEELRYNLELMQIMMKDIEIPEPSKGDLH